MSSCNSSASEESPPSVVLATAKNAAVDKQPASIKMTDGVKMENSGPASVSTSILAEDVSPPSLWDQSRSPTDSLADNSGGDNSGMERRTANKVCRVCGDKAFGYNFNVVTCESCKAFFRRNAIKEKVKEFRCPFTDNCDITVVSRRFCQKCRLRKCFEVGMKKEWILSDEARVSKKQRIVENRRKRRSYGDPDDVEIDEKPPQSVNHWATVTGSSVDNLEMNVRQQQIGFPPKPTKRLSIDPIIVHQTQQQRPHQIHTSINMSPGDTSTSMSSFISGHRVKSDLDMFGMLPNRADREIVSVRNRRPLDVTTAMATSAAQSGVEAQTSCSCTCCCGFYPPNTRLTAALRTPKLQPPMPPIEAPLPRHHHEKKPLQLETVPFALPSNPLSKITHSWAVPPLPMTTTNAGGGCCGEAPTMLYRTLNVSSPAREDYRGLGVDLCQILPVVGPLSASTTAGVNRSLMSSPESAFSTLHAARQQDSRWSHHCNTTNCHQTPPQLSPSSQSTPLSSSAAALRQQQQQTQSAAGSALSGGGGSLDMSMFPAMFGAFIKNELTTVTSDCGVSVYRPPPLGRVADETSGRQSRSRELSASTVISSPVSSHNATDNPPVSDKEDEDVGVSESLSLSSEELDRLNELLAANEVMQHPMEQKIVNDDQAPAPPQVISLVDIVVRRLIKMCKRIAGFRSLCQDDQVALLKGNCTSLAILRGAMFYDAKNNRYTAEGLGSNTVGLDFLKQNSRFYEEHTKFLLGFKPEWRESKPLMLILGAITLFNADTEAAHKRPTNATPDVVGGPPVVKHPDTIKRERDAYLTLLKRFIEVKCSDWNAEETYTALMGKLLELDAVNRYALQWFLGLKPTDIKPLLMEIFDLKRLF